MMTEADKAFYEVEIKPEPDDVDTDCRETQMIDYDTKVKEEEAGETYGDCGVTQDAANELYADHIIKQEMAIGPVVLQRCLPSATDTPREYINTLCKSKAFKSSSPVINQSEENLLQVRVCEHSCPGDNSSQCEVMENKFTVKSVLIRHKQLHTAEKSFCCNICNKQFSLKRYLTRHKRTHTRVKPFSCEICRKQFTLEKTLTRHKQIHTNKVFYCEICNKLFTQKRYLYQHVQIHTGVKSFCCAICRKQFTRMHDLTRHQGIHSRAIK